MLFLKDIFKLKASELGFDTRCISKLKLNLASDIFFYKPKSYRKYVYFRNFNSLLTPIFTSFSVVLAWIFTLQVLSKKVLGNDQILVKCCTVDNQIVLVFFFHKSYVYKQLDVGKTYIMSSSNVKVENNTLTCTNPEMNFVRECIKPVYMHSLNARETKFISDNFVRAVQRMYDLKLIEEFDYSMLKAIHQPTSERDLFSSLHYLANYMSLLEYVLINYKKKQVNNYTYPSLEFIDRSYGITLRAEQISAVYQLFNLAKNGLNSVMVGEVASGKTYVLAAVSWLLVTNFKFKVAVVSPTRILGEQTRVIFEKLNMGNSISCGSYGILKQKFDFVIFDEEQKYGAKIKEECSNFILSTATPIPRTMQQIRHGLLHAVFLSKSTSHITTSILDYSLVSLKGIMDQNPKLLIVTDTIAEQLKLAKELNITCLLNGRMSDQEQLEAIMNLKNRATVCCIATSVVEVGIDVVDLNTIVVVNAHMFGFSQLHQLRGRVGRNGFSGNCVLMIPKVTRDSFQRLACFRDSSSGWLLSEKDLIKRGFGKLFGTVQSGLKTTIDMNFIADTYLDMKGSELSAYYELASELFAKIPEKQ